MLWNGRSRDESQLENYYSKNYSYSKQQAITRKRSIQSESGDSWKIVNVNIICHQIKMNFRSWELTYALWLLLRIHQIRHFAYTSYKTLYTQGNQERKARVIYNTCAILSFQMYLYDSWRLTKWCTSFKSYVQLSRSFGWNNGFRRAWAPLSFRNPGWTGEIEQMQKSNLWYESQWSLKWKKNVWNAVLRKSWLSALQSHLFTPYGEE